MQRKRYLPLHAQSSLKSAHVVQMVLILFRSRENLKLLQMRGFPFRGHVTFSSKKVEKLQMEICLGTFLPQKYVHKCKYFNCEGCSTIEQWENLGTIPKIVKEVKKTL